MFFIIIYVLYISIVDEFFFKEIENKVVIRLEYVEIWILFIYYVLIMKMGILRKNDLNEKWKISIIIWIM